MSSIDSLSDAPVKNDVISPIETKIVKAIENQMDELKKYDNEDMHWTIVNFPFGTKIPKEIVTKLKVKGYEVEMNEIIHCTHPPRHQLRLTISW